MTRSEITTFLNELFEHHHKNMCYAKEVTFNYGMQDMFRVDYVTFKPRNQSVSGIEQGIVTAYEIKSCLDDYKSKNGHNMFFDKNYYVMTMETLVAIDARVKWLDWGRGCYVPVPQRWTVQQERETPTKFGTLDFKAEMQRLARWDLVCAIKTKQQDRNIPLSTCLFNMLRSGK